MSMTGFKPTCHPLLNCSGSRRRFAPTCQESLKRLRPILRSRLSQSSVDAENCKIPCETSGQFCGFSGGLSLKSHKIGQMFRKVFCNSPHQHLTDLNGSEEWGATSLGSLDMSVRSAVCSPS